MHHRHSHTYLILYIRQTCRAVLAHDTSSSSRVTRWKTGIRYAWNCVKGCYMRQQRLSAHEAAAMPISQQHLSSMREIHAQRDRLMRTSRLCWMHVLRATMCFTAVWVDLVSCVCMYVCMFVCMYACIHTHTRARRVFLDVCAWDVCMYVRGLIYMRMCVFIFWKEQLGWSSLYVHVHISTSTRICMCVRTHTHPHTHTHISAGKTFLLKVIAYQLRKKYGGKVGVTAPTGIAAVLIEGTTLHSFAGCGRPSCVKQIDKIWEHQSKIMWQGLKALIIDEVWCICTCMHACMHVCMNVCMYVCMHTYCEMANFQSTKLLPFE